MQRIQRAVTLLLLVGVAASQTGCQGCGMLLNLALGIGAAVGTYYLTKALTD